MFLKSHLKKLSTNEKPTGQNTKVPRTKKEGNKKRYASRVSLAFLFI